jgi:hypothetical protein
VRAGQGLLRKLRPNVDSAAYWWQADEQWIAVAITYSGLPELGVPEDSSQSSRRRCRWGYPRGLYFIFFSAKAMAMLEFLQAPVRRRIQALRIEPGTAGLADTPGLRS